MRPRARESVRVLEFATEAYLESFRQQHGSPTPFCVTRTSTAAPEPARRSRRVAIFARRLLRGEPVSVYARAQTGDPGCVRDYVYIDDVVEWNLRAVRGRRGRSDRDVATGEATTTLALAERMKGSANSTSEIRSARRGRGSRAVGARARARRAAAHLTGGRRASNPRVVPESHGGLSPRVSRRA